MGEMPRYTCVTMSTARLGSSARSRVMGAVHIESKGKASRRLQLSNGTLQYVPTVIVPLTCLDASYHGTPTCTVFACCCTRTRRAPRFGAETSEIKRAIRSAGNNALCNPAVRWADLRSSMVPKIWTQARHSVNSPIIVARNGCKALQGSGQIRRAAGQEPTAWRW